MSLSPMMGLMVEEMIDQHPQRFGDVCLKSTGEPGLGLRQAVRRPGRPPNR